jgi:cytoplasmic iron level regulating protein YaaA (DUF328/UPF0246 family)
MGGRLTVLILLPPSEGKALPARGKPLELDTLCLPEINPAREQMMAALVDLCSGDPEAAATTLGIGATQHELIGVNADLVQAPTARADQIYAGVLYDALDLQSLPSQARARATRQLLITSALFGMVRPSDRIPSYRLSGGTRLPSLGGVAAYWRKHLTEPMNDLVGDGLLLDLRSSVYAGFWKPVGTRTATVRVLHESNGQRKVVSHFNKATKGHLTRALLSEGVNPRDPLELADNLKELGWLVETTPKPNGAQLDVIVEEI